MVTDYKYMITTADNTETAVFVPVYSCALIKGSVFAYSDDQSIISAHDLVICVSIIDTTLTIEYISSTEIFSSVESILVTADIADNYIYVYVTGLEETSLNWTLSFNILHK